MYMIKRILFVSIALFSAQWALAQTATLTWGGESKDFTPKRSNALTYVGQRDSSTYVIQWLAKNPQGMFLTRYDKDLRVMARHPLGSGWERPCLGGYANEKSIDLVMLDYTKQSLKTTCLSFDPLTLEPKGEGREMKSLIANGEGALDLDMMQSPDGKLNAAIYYVATPGRDLEAQISLMDNTMEEYWATEGPVGSTSEKLLTDSGEVVLGSFKQLDNQSIMGHLTCTDGEAPRTYTFEQKTGYVRSMRIVRYDGTRVTLTGMIQDPSEIRQSKTIINAIYVLVFNTEKNRVERFTTHELTPIECSRLQNNKDSYTRDHSITFLDYFGSLSDEEGTLAVYRHRFLTTTNGVPTSETFGGLLLMRINPDGTIAWTRTLRNYTQVPPDMASYCSNNLSRVGDKAMILLLDSPKNRTHDDTKPVHTLAYTNTPTVLAAHFIDRQGNISTQYLDMPAKSAMIGHPHRVGEKQFKLLMTSYSNSTIGTLTIE